MLSTNYSMILFLLFRHRLRDPLRWSLHAGRADGAPLRNAQGIFGYFECAPGRGLRPRGEEQGAAPAALALRNRHRPITNIMNP